MPKAATTECAGCHYRFEKPSMHKVETTKTTGSSTGGSIGVGGKGKSRNPRVSKREYKRKVTEWYFADCYKKRKDADRKGCLWISAVIVAVVIYFVFIH